MSSKRQVAIVVQRYGAEIIGGAESHARMIAERLVRSGKYHVDVFTSTSRTVQWDDEFPSGDTVLNGVTIRRFRTELPRSSWFPWLHQVAKIKNQSFVSRWLPSQWIKKFENVWYKTQGPYCPSLIHALSQAANRYEGFIFFTYLYFPTAIGLPQVAARSILVPTIHDETGLYNFTTLQLLTSARTILANTLVERDLILKLDQNLAEKIVIAGAGIEPPRYGLECSTPQRTYGLYLGRIGRAKGVDRLIKKYVQMRKAGQAPWELWLVGEMDSDLCIKNLSGVCYLGSVDEPQKWRLIQQAAFILNPSLHESLSLTTLEALAAGRPVVLNGSCPVFRSYSQEFAGVHLYGHNLGLDAAVNAAIATPFEMLEQTRHTVLSRFNWDRILGTYHEALESL